MEPSRMHAPSRVAVAALILATSALAAPAFAQAPASQPKPKTTIIFAPSVDPCDRNALACLDLALEAMGGGSRLSAVKNLSYESLSYTQLTEQSYCQAPFITPYTHTKGTIDFERQRLLLDIELTWPESDPGQFQSSATVVASPNGAVRRGKSADSPASIATVASPRPSIPVFTWASRKFFAACYIPLSNSAMKAASSKSSSIRSTIFPTPLNAPPRSTTSGAIGATSPSASITTTGRPFTASCIRRTSSRSATTSSGSLLRSSR